MSEATRTGYWAMRRSENYLQEARELDNNPNESVCQDKLLARRGQVTSRRKTISGENVTFVGRHQLDSQILYKHEAQTSSGQMLPRVRYQEGDRGVPSCRIGTRLEESNERPNAPANQNESVVLLEALKTMTQSERPMKTNTTGPTEPVPATGLESLRSSERPTVAQRFRPRSSRRPSQLFLEPAMPFQNKMPISSVLLLLSALLSFSQLSTHLVANAMQPHDLDLLKILPSFAPTRGPALQHRHLRLNNSRAAPGDVTPRLALASQFEPIKASPSKFIRTNELDTYLDDMNHGELRTIAAGEPIRDLFNAKPVSSASGTSPVDTQRHTASGSVNHKQRSPKDQSAGGLVGSHSEQQIYSECALILQRTYVKSIDNSKHRLVPFGKTEQACISYKHIDKAVEQAKHKLKFREFAKMRKNPVPTGPRKPPLAPLDVIHTTLEPPEDLIAAIGEINMATTQILADQFDLSNDELLNGLPLIDMSKTKFWPLCPLLVRQDLKCRVTRFRTFTGHCNNIKHPTWGAAMTPYARYLPPVHPDGIWIPRKSIVSEITFDLGEGHREMHSNIPHPVFDVSHTEDESRHHADYRRHHQLAATREPIINHRTVIDHQIDASDPARMLLNEDSSIDNELAVDSSVHFVRRTKLDHPLGADRNMAGATVAAAVHHYHQAHSPAQFPPTTAAESTALAAHHLHQRQFHQSQQAAASSPHMHKAHQQHHSVLQDLPSARLVSSVVHRDVDQPNHDFSLAFMSWGQVINHDMTRAAQPPSSIKCCNTGQQQANGTGMAAKHKLCLPIPVPPSDPFYSKFNVQCLEFRRSLAGVRPNCVLGPRVHQNAITHLVDASFVYGSSQAQADALRLFKGGRLRDRDWFHREGLKPLLPAQEIEPDLECIARPKNLFCFLAGDVRANEQTHLTVLHTLYMREHNRLADRLGELNPHWDDERTYQEARHIVAAGIQHVLINEYIPLLIGRKMADLYNLTAQPAHSGTPMAARQAFWHGYDPTVTTSVSNSFAAAAFRQGHSFVQGTIERFNKFHEFVASEKLRFLFKQPFLLYQPGVIDELTIGMLDQPSQSHDPFMSEDVSGHLFQPPELQFGHDLAAINIQRGRDQGLPGYNLWREWCGLPRAETFEQLEPYLTNHTAFHYSRLYKHVDDIDLWSGGVSERRLPGAAIGPTFACIIARQFSNTRRGDRFWYETPGLPSSFTPDQLGELRKITLAKLLCANSDDLPTIQHWALRMAHPVLNPRVDCHQLPEMDLQFWQEE